MTCKPAAPAPGATRAPLDGVRVLDFSTLLPGPLATLMLAEAGAEVIKVERPETGDEMRDRAPRVGRDSANFAMLNRGKRSVCIDLKDPSSYTQLQPLLRSADIVLEQFRPGVMERLGLGYAAVREIKSDIIYCSLTGYGQTGPRAREPGHDLNYVAEAGLASLVTGADGAPCMPGALLGDVAGGSYAAFMNILLALRRRDMTGEGCWLDIAMADNLFPFIYGALARGFAGADWPNGEPGEWTGASPRYRFYRTRDGRYLAVAAVEQRFWKNFCGVIGLSDVQQVQPSAEIARSVETIIGMRTAQAWEALLAGADACTSVVRTASEVVVHPAAQARGLFSRRVVGDDQSIVALPLPIADVLRRPETSAPYPALGEANEMLARRE